MDFFRFVSGEKIIGYGDAVFINEKPHLHNGIRSVILFRASLSVFDFCWISVFVTTIQIRCPNIEVVVGAVEVGYRQISLQ